MIRKILALATLTLSLSLVVAPAQAAVVPVTIDYTNSANTTTSLVGVAAGDSLTLSVTGLTSGQGVYASLCKAGASQMSTPTPCDPDQSHMTWITSSSNSGSITAVQSFSTVDCLVDNCVIYIRGDHNNQSAYQLIRTVAVSFTSGGSVRLSDSATGTAGGMTMTPNVGHTLRYRTPITFNLTAASGLPITYTSLNANCAVVGNEVTALVATGVCAIGASTSGDSTYAPLDVNYPFYLSPARQQLTGSWPVLPVKVGKKVNISKSRFQSSLGLDVAIRSLTPKKCVVTETRTAYQIKGVSTGTCTLYAYVLADRQGRWNSATKQQNFVVRK